MKKHNMHLNDGPFDLIESGIKNIEYRVNDPKRQSIEIKDIITFYKRSDESKSLEVLVTELKYFKNLLDMYTQYFEEDLKKRYAKVQDVIDDTLYYPKEEIELYGCVAIRFKRI